MVSGRPGGGVCYREPMPEAEAEVAPVVVYTGDS